MADFQSLHEVNVFYDMIASDAHTLGSCVIYGGSGTSIVSHKNTQETYIRVKKHIGPSRYIRAYVHQVALLKKLGCVKLQEGHETSHLCHNKRCMNMDHLASEPHSINMSRVACANERLSRGVADFCFGHEGYSQCI